MTGLLISLYWITVYVYHICLVERSTQEYSVALTESKALLTKTCVSEREATGHKWSVNCFGRLIEFTKTLLNKVKQNSIKKRPFRSEEESTKLENCNKLGIPLRQRYSHSSQRIRYWLFMSEILAHLSNDLSFGPLLSKTWDVEWKKSFSSNCK